MKKVIKDIVIFIIVVFLGLNAVLNVYIRDGIKMVVPDIKYLFCLSIIPDRITFFGVRYNNISVVMLTVDAEVRNIVKRDFEKGLNGITATGLTMKFETKRKLAAAKEKEDAKVIIPYFKYLIIRNSKIVYWDKKEKVGVGITHITGKSHYNNAKSESEQYVLFEGKGRLNGKKNEDVYLKFFLYPHYKNKFFVNIFGSKLKVKAIEEIFKKQRLKVVSGNMNFILQMRGEMRKIQVKNIMRFNKMKMKQDIDMDLKYLFGVSVEQMIDFLTDSNGSFDINFDYEMKDEDFDKVFVVYGDKLKNSVGDRIKLGVVTAPVRGITDLIWNVTGGLFFK